MSTYRGGDDVCFCDFNLPKVFYCHFAVAGLARNGELIDYDPEDMKTVICSKYKLTGIVVHSGQASGGHYYSYILHR